jgi:hypothetical protein
MGTYSIRINGIAHAVASSDPDKPLLYVLRGLGLTGGQEANAQIRRRRTAHLIDGK